MTNQTYHLIPEPAGDWQEGDEHLPDYTRPAGRGRRLRQVKAQACACEGLRTALQNLLTLRAPEYPGVVRERELWVAARDALAQSCPCQQPELGSILLDVCGLFSRLGVDDSVVLKDEHWAEINKLVQTMKEALAKPSEQRLKEIEARCPFAQPVPGGDPSFVDSAKDVPALCKALRSFRALIVDPDNINAEFERIGDWYYQETGYLRPGKDEAPELRRDSCSPENTKRFADWFDDKKRKAFAILSGEEGE